MLILASIFPIIRIKSLILCSYNDHTLSLHNEGKRKASADNMMQQQPPMKKLSTDGHGGVIPMNSMSVDMQGSTGGFSTMMGAPTMSMTRQISTENVAGREVVDQQRKVSATLAQAWKDDIDAGNLVSSVVELFGERVLPFVPNPEAFMFL